MEFIRTGMLFLKKSKSLESLIQSHLPVVDPALQIKEEVGWGRPRNLFRPFGPKSGLQIRGGGVWAPWPPPLDLPPPAYNSHPWVMTW